MSKSTKWALVAVGLLALSALAVGVILVLVIGGGRIPGNAVLVVRASGKLPDHDSRSPIAQAFGGEIDTLMETIDSIERGAKDDRVRGILLLVGELEAGWGKTQELRSAIEEFQASGKPVVAFSEMAGTHEYYLASVANKLYMSPGGILMATGLLADASFYKGTLDKLKIHADLEHIGEFKSASEVWTRDSMSEAQRQVTNSILDSLYSQVVDGIARTRKITPSQVRRGIDTGLMTMEEAKTAKFVDDLLYKDQVEAKLEEQFGEYTEVKVRAYKKTGGFHLGARNRIAVIDAVGAIVSGRGGSSPYGSEFIGSDALAQTLKDLREDTGVRAVVLRVDSPGGSGVASDVIWRETTLLKGVKPLIVSMADVAGSGGYYIAMGADAIVAEPATITGSIGVISGKFNLRGFYDEWLGLHRDQIKRGENADLFSDYQGFTEAQRERIRVQIRAFYRDFIHKVAMGRRKTDEEIEKIARGRIWSGAQAKEIGLVDELGGLNRAIELARKKAGIGESESIAIEVYPKRKSLLEALSGQDEASTLAVRVPEPLRGVLADFDMRLRITREGIVLWTGE